MTIHTQEIIRRRGLDKGGRVQKFIDSEVIRYCDPMVPFRTGFLKNSAISGTVIGSGVIKYIAKYARKQYYENGGHGTEGVNNGGTRGRLWFARMKEKYKRVILDGAKRIAGRR